MDTIQDDRPTLILYFSEQYGSGMQIPAGKLENGRSFSLIQESVDYRRRHRELPKIGDRLFTGSTHDRDGIRTAIELPTHWVVSSVHSYPSDGYDEKFDRVVIAYCQQKPLPLEEFKNLIEEQIVAPLSESEMAKLS
ncbi:MAG: hypothetical protein WBB29_01210 [Geitlerinemataceae cyanobacterium]